MIDRWQVSNLAGPSEHGSVCHFYMRLYWLAHVCEDMFLAARLVVGAAVRPCYCNGV
jgi:hypothetical protein